MFERGNTVGMSTPNFDGGAELRAPESVGEIMQETLSYEGLVSELESVLEQLEHKLQPVLASSPEKPANDLSVPPRGSELARGLSNSNVRLFKAINAVRRLRKEVQI